MSDSQDCAQGHNGSAIPALALTSPRPVLFGGQREDVNRVVTIDAGDMSTVETRWPVDLIELVATSWGASASAYRRSREALMQADERYHQLPILVRVCACIDDTASEAARRFDAQVGRLSPRHLNNLWYVGTTRGLENLLDDVAALQLCDGVVIRELESADIEHHDSTHAKGPAFQWVGDPKLFRHRGSTRDGERSNSLKHAMKG